MLQMKALHGNNKLTTLYLRKNQLQSGTAKALGDMLLHNTHIRRIDLSWNMIGPTGGAGIAMGITHNCTLEVLLHDL